MADLICFPQNRNVGKARHVAELYLSRAGVNEREAYWRMIIKKLATVMARCGFPQSEIDQQLDAFRSAVQHQINLIHDFEPHRGSDGGPGAA